MCQSCRMQVSWYGFNLQNLQICVDYPKTYTWIKNICSYCQSTTFSSCLAVADNSNCSTDDLIKFSYDCSKPPHFEYMYSDSFARTKMFPLAAAAYSTNPALCLANGSFTLNQQRTVVCDAVGNNCSAFTAISHSDRAIIIAFRWVFIKLLMFITVSAELNTINYRTKCQQLSIPKCRKRLRLAVVSSNTFTMHFLHYGLTAVFAMILSRYTNVIRHTNYG